MSRLSAIEPANAGIRLRGTIDALATQCGFARGMSTPMPQSRPALEIVMGSEERIAKASTQRRGTRSLSPPRKTDAVATTRPCCSSLSPNPGGMALRATEVARARVARAARSAAARFTRLRIKLSARLATPTSAPRASVVTRTPRSSRPALSPCGAPRQLLHQ